MKKSQDLLHDLPKEVIQPNVDFFKDTGKYSGRASRILSTKVLMPLGNLFLVQKKTTEMEGTSRNLESYKYVGCIFFHFSYFSFS